MRDLIAHPLSGLILNLDQPRAAQRDRFAPEGRKQLMKVSISLSALVIAGCMVASSEPASAVVYCQYISYPAGCIVRPGVRLVARPVARVVTPGRPMNRGGPVNRVGRR